MRVDQYESPARSKNRRKGRVTVDQKKIGARERCMKNRTEKGKKNALLQRMEHRDPF
jgi:hypothetical protein